MSKKVQVNPDGSTRVVRSRAGEIWHQFKKNKGAMVGLVIIILIILVAIFADQLWSYKEVVTKPNVKFKLSGYTKEHPIGTDNLGRDMLARIGYGTRYSLLIGSATTLIAIIFGTTLGAIAGYYGDPIETIIMRFVEIFILIPGLLFMMVVVAAFGNSIGVLIAALGCTTIPYFARTARSSVLTVRANEYVEAAKAIGASDVHIIFKHILPNALSPIIVQVTLTVASNIVAAAGYSFLGIGVSAPTPEWGLLLSEGRGYMRQNPELTLFPGLAIMITVLALNLIGDGIRDALDPKLRR